MRAGATRADKLRAALSAGRALAERDPDDPAVVLFTSGTEGVPKGVVLSHANLLANVAQIDARFDLRLTDVFFNPLPIFHAFGLSAGMLLGLMTSMKIYLYPTPLHYRQIPELIDKVGATVLIGTDTFLAAYARNAAAYGFRTLRYVIAGAEPLKAETRRVYMEKFGLRLLEGYGVTEASPVLAVNTAAFNKVGTVGKLLPFVEPRLERVPGIDDGGRLVVRGPNVMIGYYRADNPGELEPPPGGWHDTGDIAAIDAEGFVSIKGRAKRFVKIAGELVSLGAIEDHVSGLWPDDLVATVAAPDPKRGERVILATTRRSATKAEVQTWMKIKGPRRSWCPTRSSPSTRSPCSARGRRTIWRSPGSCARKGREASSGKSETARAAVRLSFRPRPAALLRAAKTQDLRFCPVLPCFPRNNRARRTTLASMATLK